MREKERLAAGLWGKQEGNRKNLCKSIRSMLAVLSLMSCFMGGLISPKVNDLLLDRVQEGLPLVCLYYMAEYSDDASSTDERERGCWG